MARLHSCKHAQPGVEMTTPSQGGPSFHPAPRIVKPPQVYGNGSQGKAGRRNANPLLWKRNYALVIDLILNLKETGQMAFFQKAEGSLKEDEDVRYKETGKNVEEASALQQ